MSSPSQAKQKTNQFLRDSGLSLVLVALFLSSLAGQVFAGHATYSEQLRDHGLPGLGVLAYLQTGHFLEATFENWESEFLQMGLFVLLTVRLYQRGSSESNDPDAEDDEPTPQPAPPDAPWPVRRGGWILKWYEHSLSFALLLLFVVSFALHAWGGLKNQNEERALDGLPPETLLEFVSSAEFWYQSFQNWQSEFLAVCAIVIFSIFLRERGSSQSKEVAAPHAETDG
jgi:hypothetical protein